MGLRGSAIEVGRNSSNSGEGRRIVLTSVGSLGDLHPYLAIAVELQRRGHRPVVACMPALRERVEAAGLETRPLRAATAQEPSAELIRRVFNGRKGIEFIIRRLILPMLRTAYEDTCAAAAGADLLIAHPLTFATRLVAETRRLPWISTQLAPMGMLSALDPPVLPGSGWLHSLPLKVRPAVYRALFRWGTRQTRHWMRPFDALRMELGLTDTGSPLFAGGRSPLRELALFSPSFGAPQPDWPAQTVATGFPFFDQPLVADPALADFLDVGPPPVIFTLGSSAVMDPGDFFRESALAARQLGRRALLLGASPALGTSERRGDVFACGYGSYAQIFPRAAAVVHQGGVGTTAEALRGGRPMLVVPYGADQPDNAARAARLGVGRVLARNRYRARRVAHELRHLLERPAYREQAARLGAKVRSEDGSARACDLIEDALARGAVQRTVEENACDAAGSATIQSRP